VRGRTLRRAVTAGDPLHGRRTGHLADAV